MLALPLASPAISHAKDVSVRVKARLRDGPSKDSTVLGWVEPGTLIEVVDSVGGWRRVTVSDGRSGYVWREHLAEDEAIAAPPPAPANAPAATPPPPAPNELEALRADLDGLRNRPEAATAADVAQLRAEVRRLADAVGEMQRRPGDAPPVPIRETSREPMTPSADGMAGAAGLFLLGGAAIGWITSRIVQRWRERRQRIRI